MFTWHSNVVARNLHDAQASTDQRNTTEAWFGRTGDLRPVISFGKQASKTRTDSGTARRRDFRTRSLKTAWDEPLWHSAPSATPSGHGECWGTTTARAPSRIVGLNFLGLVYEKKKKKSLGVGGCIGNDAEEKRQGLITLQLQPGTRPANASRVWRAPTCLHDWSDTGLSHVH